MKNYQIFSIYIVSYSVTLLISKEQLAFAT